MGEKEVTFSNRDRDVFLISLNRGIDKGALISRYSRAAALDIREVYDREFAENPDRGSEFYRRVFSEYGDESIAELITAQLGIQNVSNVVTKTMEEQRIGLSFIEKSSRYVRYDRKGTDGYLYMKPEKIGISGRPAAEYTDLCDSLFSIYARSYDPLKKMIVEMYPAESCVFTSRSSGASADLESMDPEERKLALKAYDTAVRARALDDLRFLLPASTLTNLGVSGNARSFAYLIAKLSVSSLQEARLLGKNIHDELKSEFAEILQSVDSISQREAAIAVDHNQDFKGLEDSFSDSRVRLIGFNPEDEELRRMGVALSISNGLHQDFRRDQTKSSIRKASENRRSRRDKPGREFEIPAYQFVISTNYGAFRDLQRHRMMTTIRSTLDPGSGYDIPELIAKNDSLLSEFTSLMMRAAEVWKLVKESSGSQVAQYCVPYAYRYPVFVSINMRELVHFTELRSTPQAHYDLRHVSADMYREVTRVHPNIAVIAKFVDTKEYPLGRIFSEFKKEKRLA
ncbi:thymidylate synthase complementing protein ThyX [mine drainage metagenome]|uniref:Thymidylate synthase complementing protein ThyX n=1 Tax=mine drainage metagenome TaxID=410659 RepID=T0ZKB7_9ZZZZ